MSACNAMEDALGVTVSEPIRALRRLLLRRVDREPRAPRLLAHAPDFLGYESAPAMARDHPELVAKGLELKKSGNQVMTVVGGREIHPINVRVGRVLPRSDAT